MKLSGKQIKSLVVALLKAFPKRVDLEQLVRFELDESLDKLVGNDDMQTVHFRLIEWAESQGKLTDLLDGAKRQNPGNELLSAWIVENADSVQNSANIRLPNSSKSQQAEETSVVSKPSTIVQISDEYRVLVVENDLVYRKIHFKDLSDWGWVPIIAEGVGEALLDDARQKLRNCKCHSAIVDMRLLDNENPQDMSGLELVKEMASIPCIVVTGRGDYDVARRAGTEFGVFRIIQKIEDPEKTKEALNEAFEIWSDNKPELVPSDWIENVIRKRLFNQARENASVEEIRCLLNLLFPNADRLRAETMSRAPSSSSVQREKSFVFRATPDNLQPRVVKLAPLVDIKADVENYRQYVEEQLPGALHAQLKSHAMTWGIGGTSYSFVGDVAGSIQRFDQFYAANNDIESIKKPLNCFFRDVWDVHYRRCVESTSSVFESYNQLWKNIFDNELPKWSMEQKDTAFNTIAAPNPKRWIADNYKFSPADIEECIVHGDMHAGNLIVNDTQAWTIDFERTGPAHKLADFVELEKDVIVRLADINPVDLDSVFNALIATLTMPMRLNQLNIDAMLIKQNDEACKALLTVQYLRTTAELLFGNVDMREYYWGLLLNMMYSLCKLEDGLDELERAKTLRFAGLLCQRLKDWGRTDWLPEGWSGIP